MPLSLSSPEVGLAGVDPSAEMPGIARTKVGPSADLRQSRAESLPFAGETFDVVVSTSTFHYLRRPHEAVHEVARVLKPGGQGGDYRLVR
jgi:ubiquinone/menaquinone biosynthesis C-methylase UbiE